MLTLPPDYTFLIQLGTFLILFIVLSKALFAPFLEVLAEREARTVGDVQKAAAARAEVQSLAANVESELAKARSSANAEVDAVRRKTREEASAVVEQAQRDAAARLAELRGEVAAATQEARTRLSGDARSLADAMVAAVLGTKGAA